MSRVTGSNALSMRRLSASQCALARPGRERFWARGARKRLAGREKAFSREPARLVHALVGQADIRVVNEPGRGRKRGDACGGVEVWRCGGVEVWRCGGVERCGGVKAVRR